MISVCWPVLLQRAHTRFGGIVFPWLPPDHFREEVTHTPHQGDVVWRLLPLDHLRDEVTHAPRQGGVVRPHPIKMRKMSLLEELQSQNLIKRITKR